MLMLIFSKSIMQTPVVLFSSKASYLYDDYVELFNLPPRKDVWNSCVFVKFKHSNFSKV